MPASSCIAPISDKSKYRQGVSWPPSLIKNKEQHRSAMHLFYCHSQSACRRHCLYVDKKCCSHVIIILVVFYSFLLFFILATVFQSSLGNYQLSSLLVWKASLKKTVRSLQSTLSSSRFPLCAQDFFTAPSPRTVCLVLCHC